MKAEIPYLNVVCPYCGEHPQVFWPSGKDPTISIVCENHPINYETIACGRTIAEAMREWNRRYPPRQP